MQVDSGDQLGIILLAVAAFLLAHEQGKIRRQLREIKERLDDTNRGQR